MMLLQDRPLLKDRSQSEQRSVPSANRRGVTFARLEVGRAVRDPVARCSCWLLHRIYTAYWATDRRHRLVIQVTGWSRMDGRSHDCRHSCIHLREKGKRKINRNGEYLYLMKRNKESTKLHNETAENQPGKHQTTKKVNKQITSSSLRNGGVETIICWWTSSSTQLPVG